MKQLLTMMMKSLLNMKILIINLLYNLNNIYNLNINYAHTLFNVGGLNVCDCCRFRVSGMLATSNAETWCAKLSPSVG